MRKNAEYIFSQTVRKMLFIVNTKNTTNLLLTLLIGKLNQQFEDSEGHLKVRKRKKSLTILDL